jgi:hypothetical protein
MLPCLSQHEQQYRGADQLVLQKEMSRLERFFEVAEQEVDLSHAEL